MAIIIPQKVLIKISPANKRHLINNGYDLSDKKIKDLIEINVMDLSNKSNVKVRCKCDYCGIEFENKFYVVKDKANCRKCSSKRRSDTNLERYGVTMPSKSDIFKEKAKNTNIERYGASSPMASVEIKEKIKRTNLERYGVENPFQATEIKEKIKQTCLERYDVEYPTQSKNIRDKAKKTLLNNYGVDHQSKSEIIKDKKKQTTMDHYGVENPFQAAEIKEKIKQTNLERYGVEYIMQNEEIKKKCLQHSLEKGKFPSSKQQNYLCDLLNGKLNLFINNCICDIVLEEKKVVIEYDGSGHWLSMTLGGISLEEFNKKEYNREKRILKSNYKIIRIISRKNLLPAADQIIKLINILIDKISNFEIIKIDIDNNLIIYDNIKENYIFNELRRY